MDYQAVLLAIAKEALRRRKVRITDPNEFNRELAQWAIATKIPVDYLRGLATTVLRELFEEMVAEPVLSAESTPTGMAQSEVKAG